MWKYPLPMYLVTHAVIILGTLPRSASNLLLLSTLSLSFHPSPRSGSTGIGRNLLWQTIQTSGWVPDNLIISEIIKVEILDWSAQIAIGNQRSTRILDEKRWLRTHWNTPLPNQAPRFHHFQSCLPSIWFLKFKLDSSSGTICRRPRQLSHDMLQTSSQINFITVEGSSSWQTLLFLYQKPCNSSWRWNFDLTLPYRGKSYHSRQPIAPPPKGKGSEMIFFYCQLMQIVQWICLTSVHSFVNWPFSANFKDWA